jgi:hypothetical protein
MLKRTFCWLYNKWLSKAVNEKSDPLVRLLDAIAGSECKYCMAVRAGMIGIGIGLFNCWGLGLIVTAILLTIGERKWLCDVKS